MPLTTLNIVERKLKDIKPYERNPRKNKRAIQAVKRSVQRADGKADSP